MIKDQRRTLLIAIFTLCLVAPRIHAQSSDTSSSTPATTADVVSGTDPEPISPHVMGVLWIVLGML